MSLLHLLINYKLKLSPSFSFVPPPHSSSPLFSCASCKNPQLCEPPEGWVLAESWSRKIILNNKGGNRTSCERSNTPARWESHREGQCHHSKSAKLTVWLATLLRLVLFRPAHPIGVDTSSKGLFPPAGLGPKPVQLILSSQSNCDIWVEFSQLLFLLSPPILGATNLTGGLHRITGDTSKPSGLGRWLPKPVPLKDFCAFLWEPMGVHLEESCGTPMKSNLLKCQPT